MDKEVVLKKICDSGLVAVVRAGTADEALRIADACLQGGIGAIELTFTVPGADKVIESLAKRYDGDDLLLGAGTVMDAQTARLAMLSGANYIVSPYFDSATVSLCNQYRVAVMPGVMTVREAVMAMRAGADILKVFPGELFGPAIIKAVKGPLPYAKMMPTGGVSLENAADWIKAGAVALGVGGALTAASQTGDYKAISQKAVQFVDVVKKARKGLI
ncbi:MAG: bifunctional 2-keto-4-hydroxyglutarate aldolase/2-keto-3-deoxy-6-phosphogluconate aldolase [Clostridiales bacterium]|nr:bifunctional 2-keto-4-hydroxyglutarate aldolase/2-keto-3-deoxy-6-phosphogluconate aldolase [Clostridiales bacterium]